MDIVSSQRKIIRRRNTFSDQQQQQPTTTTTMMTRSASKRTPTTTTTTTTTNGHRRALSEPPTRKRIIDDYYRVDRLPSHNDGVKRPVVLPGVPKYGDDWARDFHDFFNLIALVPIIVLNVMNWNWDMILNMPKNKGFPDAWTGDWEWPFFYSIVLYFLVDLAWVLLVPRCVRSPATIIQHHIATLLYLLVPYKLASFRWAMGACMSVEINTWFLIARRVFNKQGFSPWVIDLPPLISIRVKMISIFFYLTWISIRCVLYPYLLVQFWKIWNVRAVKFGTRWELFAIVVPLHSVFCLLNLKWTYDLIMSKMRYWRRLKAGKRVNDDHSKGL